eukprot:1620763-Rhodomonas_salina.1
MAAATVAVVDGAVGRVKELRAPRRVSTGTVCVWIRVVVLRPTNTDGLVDCVQEVAQAQAC